MGFFGLLVKTVVNVSCLPVDAAKDVLDSMNGYDAENFSDRLQKIKDDVEGD